MRSVLLACALLAGCGHALGQARLVDSYTWVDPAPTFGGISALEVSADGHAFTAISDSARVIIGQFDRQNGQITGITTELSHPLRRTSGNPMRGENRDAEGLAISTDGTTYVSFEGDARVLAYPVPDAAATALPLHPDFPNMQPNSALEALAIDANGHLFTLAERSGRATRPFPVYRYDGKTWDIAWHLPRRGKFLPVGLDIGPDGFFYLLERDFTGIGFRSRVRRFAPGGGAEDLILQTRTGDFDNLEGISVWRDITGNLRLTMVSDDNFKFYQRTEVVEFVLTDR